MKMSRSKQKSKSGSRTERAPIRWVGVLFAVALNLLLVTLADLAVRQLGLDVTPSVALRLFAPFVAGVLTTLYVGTRGSMHAFLGGLISVPLVALFVLSGAWRVSLLAGIFCALGGAVTEVVRRGR
jgi:hypothetical protein